MLRKAGDELRARGLGAADAESLLSAVSDLASDHSFWQHQSDGLAIFASSGRTRFYRLPVPFPELVIVAERFHLKPVLPLLISGGQFYVLALSQNRVRLFQGTQAGMSEQVLEGIPESLHESIGAIPGSAQLQFHTASAGGRGRQKPVVHGQGASVASEANLRRFFSQIDQEICNVLMDEQAPLILAAVEYLVPIYRDVSHYTLLLDEFIHGNPDHTAAGELHAQAWPVVRAHIQALEEQAWDNFRKLAGTPRSSNILSDVVPAARQGRVGALFVPLGVQCWGVWDERRHRVNVHAEQMPGDEDLLNLAAVSVYSSGGTVFAVDPGRLVQSQPVAAIYRY
ncbi:MAG: hypothetical protein KGN79_01565 [Acidobacteriota bacterium]|nr:hypothetical protein [Acidobacteriota bacterium]